MREPSTKMNSLEVVIRGAPEEIAALVLAVQERHWKNISIGPEDMIRKFVRSTIDDTQKDTAS